MTLERDRIVRVYAYYTDASIIERIIANFRKLLIDIDWIHGYRCNNEGLYIFYLALKDHSNFDVAIFNLSKTVGVERVEVLEDAELIPLKYRDEDFNKIDKDTEMNCNSFITYMPKYSRVRTYSWGEIYGENIQR